MEILLSLRDSRKTVCTVSVQYVKLEKSWKLAHPIAQGSDSELAHPTAQAVIRNRSTQRIYSIPL